MWFNTQYLGGLFIFILCTCAIEIERKLVAHTLDAEIIKLSHNIEIQLLSENGGDIAERDVQREDTQMPESLVFRLRRDHEVAVLRLTKVPPLKTAACREDGRYDIQHTREDMAAYSDYSSKAVMLVTRNPQLEYFYNLEGQAQIGLRMVDIEPTEDRLGHVITKQETMIHIPNDVFESRTGHRSKRSLKTYTVEVCFIVDYQNFFQFLEMNNNNVPLSEAEIRNYYAFIAEKLKVRYHHINEVDGTIAFNVVTSGLFILEQRSQSWYSENHAVNGRVDADLSLNATLRWYSNPPAGIVLPLSDHYMFFTGYDLIRGENPSNAGLAYVGAVCKPNFFTDVPISTSIVESKARDSGAALTAAHELGHALNASHDSDVGCDDATLNIMRGFGRPIQQAELAQRPFQFSTCSVRDIKAYVQSLTVNCLNDNRYGNGVVTTTELAGQYFDVNEQCNIRYGNGSTLCDSLYRDDKDKLCYWMYCHVGGNQCRSASVMEYTTCDINRWCYRGLCIKANNTAPVFINLPSTAIEIPSNTQGTLYTVQTFDPDIGDVMTFHITWDPATVSQYFTVSSAGGVLLTPGFSLTSLPVTNFSLIMSVDDGLLLSLPINIDFKIVAPVNQPPSFTNSSYVFNVNEGKTGEVVILTLLNLVTDPDPNTVFRFRLVSFNTYFAINSGSGRITYQRDYDTDPAGLSNSVTLTVEVSDQFGLSGSANFVLNIININQPPVFQNLASSVNLPENTASGALVYDVNAVDADSTDVITYSFLNSNQFTSTYLVIDSSNGRITLANGVSLDYESLVIRTYQVVVRISTNQHVLDSVLTVTVTNSNEPPVFTQLNYSTTTTTGPAGQVIVNSLTEFVSDPDIGDRIVRFAIESARYTYLFDINPLNGQITFAREYGSDRNIYPREVALAITAEDTTSLLARTVWFITVNIANRRPTLTNLPQSVPIDENITPGSPVFTVESTDLDGDVVTYAIVATVPIGQSLFSLATNGVVSVRQDTIVDYETVPNAVYLTITASDGTVSSIPQNLTLNINNVNEPPRFNQSQYSFTVNEGQTGDSLVSSFLPFVIDPDVGEQFTFSIDPSTLSVRFFINPINGAISYSSNYDADPTRLPSQVTLTIQVKDSGNNVAASTVNFNILNVNQAPVFTNLPTSIVVSTQTADNTAVYNIGVTDIDSQDILSITPTFSPTSGSQLFSFRSSDRAVLFRNGASVSVNETFVINFRASDGRVSITQSLRVDVRIPLPDPTTQSPTTTVRQLVITNLPIQAAVGENINSTSTIYTVRTNEADTSKVTYQLQHLNTGSAILFTISNGGAVTVRPGAIIDYETVSSPVVLLITAFDGSVSSASKNLSIIINNVNEVPRFNQSQYSFTVNEGQTGEILVSDFRPYVVDPDFGETFTFSLQATTNSNYFNIDQSTGRITFAANYDTDPTRLPNQVTLSLRVTDSGNKIDSASVSLTINNVNQAPSFTSLPTAIEVAVSTTDGVILTVRSFDPDSSDSVTVTISYLTSTASQYFTFNTADRTLRFLGRQSLQTTGQFSLRFTVSDGQLSTSQNLVVTVIVAVPTTIRPLRILNLPQTISISENTVSSIYTVSTNEVDVSKVNFQLQQVNTQIPVFTINNSGQIILRSGAVIDFESLPSPLYLTITASDGSVTSQPQNLTLIINNINESPRFNQSQYSFKVNEGQTGEILVADFRLYVVDPDFGETFTFSLQATTNSNYFNIDQSTGRITFAANYDADPTRLPSQVTLSLRVTDSGNKIDSASVSLTISNVNQSPSFTSLPTAIEVAVSTSNGVIFTVRSFDPDSLDILNIRAVQLTVTGGQYFTFNSNENTVRFLGRQNLESSQQFIIQFTVSDGRLSTTANLVITVILPVTETPTTTTTRPLVITNLPRIISIRENTVSLTRIYTVATNEADVTKVTFQLRQITTGISTLFTINNDGDIMVRSGAVIDFENILSPIVLTITASDNMVSSSPQNLTVIITDVNEPPRFFQPELTYTVDEGKAGEKLVPTLLLFVVDNDRSESFNFNITNSNYSSYFTIDKSTGMISYAADFDTDPSRLPSRLSLTVTVEDSARHVASVKLNFIINNINQAPVFTNLPDRLEIPESKLTGQVFVVSVLDSDTADTLTLTQQTTEGSAYFDFNPRTGVLSLLGRDDGFGTSKTFILRFTVTDGSLSTTESLTVVILTLPTTTRSTLAPTTTPRTLGFLNLPKISSVQENTASNMTVFTVETDSLNPENVRFQLQQITTGIQLLFTIYNDGAIRVRPGVVIDFESLPSPIILTISATDDFITSQPQNLTLIINNVNEPPGFNQSQYSFTVNEGQTQTVVVDSFLPFVQDEDRSETFIFGLIPSTFSERFQIDQSTGFISFAVDYFVSAAEQVQLTVLVRDSGLLFQTVTIIVNIQNINKPPQFENLPNSVVVPATSADNSVIFTVSVSDPDVLDKLTVSLQFLVSSDSRYFSFFPNSNTLIFKNGGLLTSNQTFSLQFSVFDSTVTVKSFLTVRVTIPDIPEPTTNVAPVPPRFNQSAFDFTVTQGNVDDVLIQSLQQYIVDPLQNTNLRFSLAESDYSSYFNIDQLNGKITLASDSSPLPSNVMLTVVVSDAANSAISSTSTFTLTFVPKNNLPQFVNLPSVVTIQDTTLPGTAIFHVQTSDLDIGDILTVVMEHVDDTSKQVFNFDSTTRNVSVSQNVIFVRSQTYFLQFQVDDGKDSTQANLTIVLKIIPTTPTSSARPTNAVALTTRSQITTDITTSIPTDTQSLLKYPWAISAIIIVCVLVPVILVMVICFILRRKNIKKGSTEYIYDNRSARSNGASARSNGVSAKSTTSLRSNSTGPRSIPISYYPKYNLKGGFVQSVYPHSYPHDFNRKIQEEEHEEPDNPTRPKQPISDVLL